MRLPIAGCKPIKATATDFSRIDLVTVSYKDEIRLLRLQARSICRHVDPDFIGAIYVISNDIVFSSFRRAFEASVLSEYGHFRSRVRLIDAKTFLTAFYASRGWVRQQILKLKIAERIESPHYLILDSKNHFLKPYNQAAAFDAEGRAYIHRFRLNPAFDRQFERACALFGVTPTDAVKQEALPQATPYMVKRDLVRHMIKQVEDYHGTFFDRCFVKNGPYTEFYLFYAFLLRQEGLIEAHYHIRYSMNVTFWNPAVETQESFTQKLDRIDSEHVLCMGIHKRYVKLAPTDFKAQLAKVWARYGLVKDSSEADYFLSPPQKPPFRIIEGGYERLRRLLSKVF